ncbi:hypothetical protein NDU88_001860 [Pleurodeles waltl]|uniref:Uncharacterized protein n=1 Tax=Pleurodeles waltl TaxID=8319 RepID=A0AAV7MR44_PLEWA|nr:hypothetical protein NDU88_001860 [Pleurodeles waltl]
MANTMREAVAHQCAPDTSHTKEQPSTSADTSGQEALPQEQQATRTPNPAEGEPPRKRSLRSRQKPENIAKTPASQCPSEKGYLACHRQGGVDPEGLLQAEHPLPQTVGGPVQLGKENVGSLAGAGLGLASQRGRGARRTLTPP